VERYFLKINKKPLTVFQKKDEKIIQIKKIGKRNNRKKLCL